MDKEQEELLRRRTYEGSASVTNQHKIVHTSLPELTGEQKARSRKQQLESGSNGGGSVGQPVNSSAKK